MFEKWEEDVLEMVKIVIYVGGVGVGVFLFGGFIFYCIKQCCCGVVEVKVVEERV